MNQMKEGALIAPHPFFFIRKIRAAMLPAGPAESYPVLYMEAIQPRNDRMLKFCHGIKSIVSVRSGTPFPD